MASWAAVLALTGFDYQASTGAMAIALEDGAPSTFWSTGNAWGTIALNDGAVVLAVRYGELNLASVVVNGERLRQLNPAGVLAAPASLTIA